MAICPVCDRPVMFEFQCAPAGAGKNVGQFVNEGFNGDPFAPSFQQQRQGAGIGLLSVKRTLPGAVETVIPDHVPENVGAAFSEGLKAREAGLLPSAVYNLRKSLERTVRDRDPEGKGGLKMRIKKMSEDGKIPSTLVDLAHTVRAEGNVEVHEEETWTPEQVQELIDFSILLLTYVYTLPNRIAAIAEHRGKPAGER